ncbi:HNH endonuclease [Pseudomonas sp. NPDC087346]|uniref:HNH endonuclease n=1 Tax=Pseudomonas sp. NPDC087346 TaxID=3364438 RepID=UPI00381E057E
MTTSVPGDAIHIRLRRELAEYLARPHRTKKLRAETRDLVHRLFRKTRKGLADGWTLLEALNPEDGDIATASQLKAALRDQLVKQQGNRCCYCRRWLVNTAYARPIEHVLPKASYAQFSLHFWNLAVACTDCNSKKTNTIWGSIDPNRLKYPLPSSIEDWYHPRFHDYDQHIRYVRLESNETTVIVYQGKTPQGMALCNSLLRHIAAKEMLIANNPALSSFVATINECGDRFDAAKTEKLRDFQDELGASVTRMIDI